MTKHFSFETNESRRHFMKLMAGVGAGLAFSGTLGTFAPKPLLQTLKVKPLKRGLLIHFLLVLTQ